MSNLSRQGVQRKTPNSYQGPNAQKRHAQGGTQPAFRRPDKICGECVFGEPFVHEGVSIVLFDVRKVMVSHFMDITTGLAGSFSLTLPWSPSVNHTWRQAGGRLILDKRVEAFRKKVAGKVNFLRTKRNIPSKAIECDCMVMLEYMPPDRRRRDIDNGCKAVFDALTHAGVWKDDSQVKLMLSFFGRTVKGGAVKVLIQPLEV